MKPTVSIGGAAGGGLASDGDGASIAPSSPKKKASGDANDAAADQAVATIDMHGIFDSLQRGALGIYPDEVPLKFHYFYYSEMMVALTYSMVAYLEAKLDENHERLQQQGNAHGMLSPTLVGMVALGDTASARAAAKAAKEAAAVSSATGRVAELLREAGTCYARIVLHCSNFENTDEDQAFFECVFMFVTEAALRHMTTRPEASSSSSPGAGRASPNSQPSRNNSKTGGADGAIGSGGGGGGGGGGEDDAKADGDGGKAGGSKDKDNGATEGGGDGSSSASAKKKAKKKRATTARDEAALRTEIQRIVAELFRGRVFGPSKLAAAASLDDAGLGSIGTTLSAVVGGRGRGGISTADSHHGHHGLGHLGGPGHSGLGGSGSGHGHHHHHHHIGHHAHPFGGGGNGLHGHHGGGGSPRSVAGGLSHALGGGTSHGHGHGHGHGHEHHGGASSAATSPKGSHHHHHHHHGNGGAGSGGAGGGGDGGAGHDGNGEDGASGGEDGVGGVGGVGGMGGGQHGRHHHVGGGHAGHAPVANGMEAAEAIATLMEARLSDYDAQLRQVRKSVPVHAAACARSPVIGHLLPGPEKTRAALVALQDRRRKLQALERTQRAQRAQRAQPQQYYLQQPRPPAAPPPRFGRRPPPVPHRGIISDSDGDAWATVAPAPPSRDTQQPVMMHGWGEQPWDDATADADTELNGGGGGGGDGGGGGGSGGGALSAGSYPVEHSGSRPRRGKKRLGARLQKKLEAQRRPPRLPAAAAAAAPAAGQY
eukprot:g2670.t1